MKNILFVANSIENGSYGGVNNYLKIFMENFYSNKISISFFSLGRSPKWFIRKHSDSPTWYFLKQIFNIVYLPVYIKANKIDAVQFFPTMSKGYTLRLFLYSVFVKLSNVKVIIFFRGWNDDDFLYMKRNKIYNRVLNFLFVNQHIIIVLSSKFRENLKDSFPKLENKKILVSKTIVNTKKYSFNRNYDRKTFRLLFCGEIKHSKGVFLVYDCFKDISNSYGNIELFIMGKGDSEKELIDKIIADKSNKVKYFGYLNSKQKKVVYKSSDLFVFPSYHKEGFPNVISEACAAGLPIIAMDSGGVSEGVLGKHNGYLLQNFKPNNKKINILLDSQGKLKYDISASIVEEMKNHIVKLMENKDLYKKMSYNSLQLSKEKFGIEVIFRQLENSYKKIFHL